MKTSPATSIALSLAAMFALSAYNCNDVLDDPGFDLWCGDRLCAWQLEQGELRKAPTWHRSDTGVELVGPEVAISQFANQGSSLQCLRFELIADVEETAAVTLELDFFADGIVDHEQGIPTSDWAELSYRIRMPGSYQGILFRIRKRGSGRAVLAEIAALSESPEVCGDLPALSPVPHPTGAACLEDDVCKTRTCAAGDIWMVCSECATSSECGASEVCGMSQVAPRHLGLYRACTAMASHGLGERCVDDAECSTGICAEGVCSTCRQDTDCPSGQTCRERQLLDGSATPELMPWQCEPQAGLAGPGVACLAGDDCQSGACQGQGERRVCLFDARSCTADGDCPPDDLLSSSDTGTCVTVGVIDGVCQ